jgi:hypothetical protein
LLLLSPVPSLSGCVVAEYRLSCPNVELILALYLPSKGRLKDRIEKFGVTYHRIGKLPGEG